MAMTVTELAEQVRESNTRLTEAIRDLRQEVAESRQEFRQELGGLRQEFAESRKELAESRQELRTELGELRQELGGLRQEFRRELGELRQEFRQELGGLRQEFAESRQEFINFRVEVGNRLSSIDTSLRWAKWIAGIVTPVVIGLVAWAFTAVERATRIEEAVKGLHETTRAQSQMIQEIKDSMTALRDVAQAHGKQIEELARVVSAKPPAVDPPGIKVLIEQTKQVRDELKQIRDAVSRSGAASRPR